MNIIVISNSGYANDNEAFVDNKGDLQFMVNHIVQYRKTHFPYITETKCNVLVFAKT